MKGILRTVVVICAFALISSNAFAGGGPVVIKALPFTITAPGAYALTKSLATTTDTDGITVNANNVTIDFGGFGITGPGTTRNGIFIAYNNKRVEIRNGFITGFDTGIRQAGIEDVTTRVINMKIYSNASYGININARGNLVKDCTVEGSIIGIYTGVGSTVTGNIITGNTMYGIFADFGCMISGNTVYSNPGTGIYAYPGGSIINNLINNNTGKGLDGSNSSLVNNNSVFGNGDVNISLTGGGSPVGTNFAP